MGHKAARTHVLPKVALVAHVPQVPRHGAQANQKTIWGASAGDVPARCPAKQKGKQMNRIRSTKAFKDAVDVAFDTQARRDADDEVHRRRVKVTLPFG